MTHADDKDATIAALSTPLLSRRRHPLVIDQLAIFALLILNAVSYFVHIFIGLWANSLVVVLIIAYAMVLNNRHMLAKHFSWANIFVTLLALFHLGYYFPAKLGWIDEVSYLPVNNAIAEIAILLFTTSLLAFEMGVLFGCRRAWERRLRDCGKLKVKDDDPCALLRVGLPILGLSILFLLVFVFQEGGVGNLLRSNYTDFMAFQAERDPRFLLTGIEFFPVGILIIYIALVIDGSRYKEIGCIRVLAAVFILWLLITGSRGTALLLLVAFLYAGHLCKKPLPWRTLLVVGVLAAVIIPVIAAYRNVATGDRAEAVQDATFVPFAAAVEMGQTYRTFVGFVDFFWSQNYPLMMGRSYWIAASHLIPNIGLQKGEVPGGEYYRSAMWITEMLDPATAAISSGGLGSTGIGEPYANFGYLGVVGFFGLLGLVIGGLEQYFLLTRSNMVVAIIFALFIPLNWYIRDDFYGLLRPVAWSIAAILIGFFFISKTRKCVVQIKPIPNANSAHS